MCAFLIMSNGWWTWYFAISPLALSLCINQLPSHLMVTFHPSPGADQFKIRENVRDGATGHQVIKKGENTGLLRPPWAERTQDSEALSQEYSLLPINVFIPPLGTRRSVSSFDTWDHEPGLRGFPLTKLARLKISFWWENNACVCTFLKKSFDYFNSRGRYESQLLILRVPSNNQERY